MIFDFFYLYIYLSPSSIILKTLLLIRHAKSDWDTGIESDFERPLNERGKRDAPLMAHRLLDKTIPIDLIMASPAKRAAKTAKLFAEAYTITREQIVYKPELYLAGPEVFLHLMQAAPDSCNHLAVFSHNNGITDFANLLTQVRVDNIPTCGIFAIKIHCNSWADFAKAEKEFWFFDYPKA